MFMGKRAVCLHMPKTKQVNRAYEIEIYESMTRRRTRRIWENHKAIDAKDEWLLDESARELLHIVDWKREEHFFKVYCFGGGKKEEKENETCFGGIVQVWRQSSTSYLLLKCSQIKNNFFHDKCWI